MARVSRRGHVRPSCNGSSAPGIVRIAREQHAALRRSLALVNAALESTADGLLIVDGAGGLTRYNQRFLTMWRIPPDLAATGDDRRLLSFVHAQLTDPDRFVRRVQALYADEDGVDFETLDFLDGRRFERYHYIVRLIRGSRGQRDPRTCTLFQSPVRCARDDGARTGTAAAIGPVPRRVQRVFQPPAAA
jgi:PAS domain-containing protein